MVMDRKLNQLIFQWKKPISRIGGMVLLSTSLCYPSTRNFCSSSSSKVTFTPSLISTAAIKGRRPYMEDEYVVSDDKLYAAVFDGHGGAEVSKYAKIHAYPQFAKLLGSKTESQSNEEVAKILTQSLLDVDQEVQKITKIRTQGATACVTYLNTLAGETSIITANVGDSRAVLSRNRTAIDLSVDHKPNLPSEQKRIEALGGSVVWVGDVDKKTGLPIEATGVYRVNGILALSRSLGDVYLKPYVSPLADITITSCSPDDEFVIIATDGLWDVFSSSTAVDLVHQVLGHYNTNPPEFEKFSEADKIQFLEKKENQIKLVKDQMASILVDLAFKYQSWDNISAVVIWLK